KMRELALMLAVRGTLVEQKESDGNADSIFGKTQHETPPPRFEVPGSWIWIRFADVGEQRLGKMLDQRGNQGDLKPYLRNTNVQWMRFELDDIKELRLEPEELEEYRLVPGDLLICEGGEPGRCAIWFDPTREMYFQKAIHRVRPRPGILASYLAICLQVDSKNGVLVKLFTGATIKHLTGRSLREYTIPLPPLAEQKRIVAKVDELMTLCDRLEAQQREREERTAALARASLARFADAPTPANLGFLFHKSYVVPPEELRKSILTLAVQGKLVPQDPEGEPAEELVKDLKSKQAALSVTEGLRMRQPVTGLDRSEWPTAFPATWAFPCFDDVMVIVSGVTKGRKLVGRQVITLPYLRVANVQRGYLVLDVIKEIEALKEDLDRYRLVAGDVLMTEGGDWDKLGRAAIWNEEIADCIHQNHVYRVRSADKEKLIPGWITLFAN
ncbi:MAG: restriction endonuclease subunit S, partial [Verrucomicrobiales bacterium]